MEAISKTQIKSLQLLAIVLIGTPVHSNSVSMQGMGLQGMGENCILSFVVPRDKMKSSCELNGKVSRRINAMEMKVNIYKQQVAELQAQLEKQRVFSKEKLTTLDKKVRESTVNAELSFLIERRLALLEKEFEQLHEDMAKVKVNPASSSTSMDNSEFFNAVDQNPVTLPNLVHSMVQSEVKTLMVNLSKQLESYVHEQILLYNQVFSDLPTLDKEDISGRTFTESAKGLNSNEKKHKKHKEVDDQATRFENELQTDLEKVKATLDHAGEKIAKHVGDYMKNVSSAPKESKGTDTYPDVVNLGALLNETLDHDNRSLEMDLTEALQDANDSYSGEHSDSASLTTDNLTNVDTEIPVSSRMSHGAEISGSDLSKEQASASDKGEKKWMDNMVGDQQSSWQAAMEKRLMTTITSMLYSPVNECMSLMEKQSKKLQEQVASHRSETKEVALTLGSQIKGLEQRVLGTAVKLDSLTKGFLEVRELTDGFKPLEAEVDELKKNVSASSNLDVSPHELDEQFKKVRNLERLIGVYQNSLDHYVNETKLEYREKMSKVQKEMKKLRKMSTEIRTSATSTINTSLNKLNSTFSDKFDEIDKIIRNTQDNSMMLQLDINTIERKVNGKSSRSEKDLDELRDNIRQATNKHRDFRRRIEAVEQEQVTLVDQLNATAKDVFNLKMEVKLSLLDQWLPLSFEYDMSRTGCFGDQYVKKSPFKEARLVGVVLCNSTRYKIFLSNSTQATFLNIGDTDGLGEDHCEFVGAKDESKVVIAPFKPSYGIIDGYLRPEWGEAPVLGSLNAIYLSPRWYECGMKIP